MPYSLLFFTACCTDYYCRHMPYCLLFVAACHTVRYLLLHAVQFAICCRTLHSSLLAAAWRTDCFFVAACRAVYYWLPHAILFAICYHMPDGLPHALQFAICCLMLYTSLFLATWYTVCYLCRHMRCRLLFATTCHIVCHAHALQFTICCRMPYSLLRICCRMLCSRLFATTCRAVCYLLPHAI